MNIFYIKPPRSDELYHYGVLGMKWGQHRAAKNGSSYAYKSWGTKHYEKKAAKIDKKLNADTESSTKNFGKLALKKAKYMRRASRSRELDRREQEYADSQSIKVNVAKRVLTNNAVGGKTYQRYAAMMNAHGKVTSQNIDKKIVAAGAAYAGGRVMATPVKALYLRKGERQYMKQLKEIFE